MKTSVIVFQGGMGNQMFQYALFCSLKNKYPNTLFCFDTHYSDGAHWGFELFRVFNIGGKFNSKLCSLLLTSKLRKFLIRNLAKIEDENAYRFDPQILENNRSCMYCGYWQSEKYFADVENVVRKSFRFNESQLNEGSKNLYHLLRKNYNSISLHVRRGDYLNINGGSIVLGLDYYERAIDYENKHVEDPRYFVFSDDMSWVKDNLKIPNAIYVDCNYGNDSWQDMFLMSKCKHNIIANSSFSWWGAWLNDNPEKIIVSPKWEGDIIPEKWIQM